MSIISAVERRSIRGRLLLGVIYALLVAGGVTMLYPFLLMVSGATKSAVDVAETGLIPRFLVSDDALYAKHCEGFFNESLEMLRTVHDTETTSFRKLEPSKRFNVELASTWRSFLETQDLPPHSFMLSYIFAPVSRGVMPYNFRLFKDTLSTASNGDISKLNLRLGTQFPSWKAFFIMPANYLLRTHSPGNSPLDQVYNKFKQSRPYEERIYFSAEGFYRHAFLKNRYSKDISAYNRAHGTNHESWSEVHLSRRAPSQELQRRDWEVFVRQILGLSWIRLDPEATRVYRGFLQSKYRTIEALNDAYQAEYATFGDVGIPVASPATGPAVADLESFIQGWSEEGSDFRHIAPLDGIALVTTDWLYRDYLKTRFGTIENMNAETGTDYSEWKDILPPQRDFHYLAFMAGRSWLRWEFARRNFVTVADYILLHGRGILNTAIYCVLAVLGALVVNPLAAYALSRYNPPSSYKALLFLMLTMAFPPMVTQIPAFLLLRELGMLNSFWALVLPGLANGYSIFLLKGFFDSLPSELYESAQLDGAGELRIFWQITMSLSKPILAVIALQAFTLSYSNFMMALLVCQDQKMWTLMPWLYQLQQTSGQGVVLASLLVAAIPTFAVFAFCQNIIMRGIVVPVEK